MINQTVSLVDLPEISVLGCPLVVKLGQVVRLDRSRVDAQRSTLVIDFLLKHSRGGVDVDGWVARSPVPELLIHIVFLSHLSN